MPTSPIIRQRIDQLENEYRQRLAAQRVLFRDQIATLPVDLQRRVNRIMRGAEIGRIEERVKQEKRISASKSPSEQGGKPADEEAPENDNCHEETEEDGEQKQRSIEPFNESKVTLVLDQQQRHPDLDLHIEARTESRRPKSQAIGWLANMVRQKRAERVCWPSKLYHFDRKFSKKTLFQQAEQMTELCAEDFADWLAGLGNDHQVTITKEIIMQLFSIGIEGDSAKALCVEPRPRKAVPFEVAVGLGLPNISIERNVERLLAADKRNRITVPRKVAFGRSLPVGLYTEISDTICKRPLEPKFPDTLHTKRSVFEGITHLRSTKAIVRHLKQQNEGEKIRRPEYLIQSGCFRSTESKIDQQTYTPLYADFMKIKN